MNAITPTADAQIYRKYSFPARQKSVARCLAALNENTD